MIAVWLLFLVNQVRGLYSTEVMSPIMGARTSTGWWRGLVHDNHLQNTIHAQSLHNNYRDTSCYAEPLAAPRRCHPQRVIDIESTQRHPLSWPEYKWHQVTGVCWMLSTALVSRMVSFHCRNCKQLRRSRCCRLNQSLFSRQSGHCHHDGCSYTHISPYPRAYSNHCTKQHHRRLRRSCRFHRKETRRPEPTKRWRYSLPTPLMFYLGNGN